jgi:AcrR family transcriptional regulator
VCNCAVRCTLPGIARSRVAPGGTADADVVGPFALLAQAVAAAEPTDPTTLRVLDAAYEEFSLVGIQRTSMEDVARRAQVSRVTVYRHVASKDALVELVLRREFQRHVGQYLAAIEAADTAADRVVEGYLTAIQALRRNPLLSGLLPTELDTLVASMAGSAEHVLAMARLFVAQLLHIERAAGEIADHIDVDVVADLMVRLAVSYILIPSDVVDLDDEDASRAVVRSFLLPILGWSP